MTNPNLACLIYGCASPLPQLLPPHAVTVEVADAKARKLKMYILIKKSVATGLAINAAAHASLIAWKNWQDDLVMRAWDLHSFKKVTCAVTDGEFESAKLQPINGVIAPEHYRVVTESALHGMEVAMVFKPQHVWPEFFKKLELYK